jgi:hypothetical protein
MVLFSGFQRKTGQSRPGNDMVNRRDSVRTKRAILGRYNLLKRVVC